MSAARALGVRSFRWALGPRGPSPWRSVLAFLVVYGLLLVVLGLTHEPWRDEADAWLYARDLDLGSLRRFTSNAGTPALWYFVLLGFAKSGLPYAAMFVVHGLLATLAVAALLRWAPFSPPIKALFCCSFFMGYEYSVVARSYVLVVLLLFVLASLHRLRGRRPLLYGVVLGLLFNASAFGAVCASGIFLVFAWDVFNRFASPRARMGALVAGSLALAALWQLWPGSGGQFRAMSVGLRPSLLLESIGAAFFPQLRWEPGVTLATSGATCLLVLSLWSVVGKPRALVPLLLGVVGIFGLLSTGIDVSLRHQGMLQMIVVYALWVGALERGSPRLPGQSRARHCAWAMWLVSLIVSLPLTVEVWCYSALYASSGSKQVAEFILEHGIDREPIAGHSPAKTEAVLPWLRCRTFYYPALGTDSSHMWWDRAYYFSEYVPLDIVLARVERRFVGKPHCLLLHQPLPESTAGGYELIYSSQEEIIRRSDEEFFLYRSKRTTPPR